jgi:hypothetical protein
LITRDVKVGAQRPPDVPGIDAVLNGLRRGAPAERGQYVVDEQRPPPHGPEVALDKLVEFGQPHIANVPTHSGVSAARRGIPGRYNTFSPR